MGYPVSIEMAGRPCLVVGAGKVAGRKIRGLLEAGALVTVVAPEAAKEIAALARAGKITLRERAFEAGDVKGAFMAFIATSSPETNREAAILAKVAGALVNMADGGEGDFTLPAVTKKGPVTVAVDTGGSSPAMAAWLRDVIEARLPGGLNELAEVLKALRAERKTGGSSKRWKELLESGFPEDLARGDYGPAAEKLERTFGPEAKRRAARIFKGQ